MKTKRMIGRTERIAPDSEKARELGFETGLAAGDAMEVIAVVLAYDQWGEFVGYYEALRDGSFSCVIGRDSEWTRDEGKIRAWLCENAE